MKYDNECSIRGCHDDAKRKLTYMVSRDQTKTVQTCMKHTNSVMSKHSVKMQDYIPNKDYDSEGWYI